MPTIICRQCNVRWWIVAVLLAAIVLLLCLNWKLGHETRGTVKAQFAGSPRSPPSVRATEAPSGERNMGNFINKTSSGENTNRDIAGDTKGDGQTNQALVFDRGQIEHAAQNSSPENGLSNPRDNSSSTSRAAVKQNPVTNCTYCLLYDLRAPLTGDFDCVPLQTDPSPPICLHPKEDDVFVSQLIRETGIWERHIVEQFQGILLKDHRLGVIDLGANIGQYSLLAAKMGHPVLAAEPYTENIKRLQKAAQLAELCDSITLLQNAVSDNRGDTFMVLDAANQGDSRLSATNKDAPDAKVVNVKVLHLDDLVPFVTFNSAVMKIDIQGHEHRAFAHANKLLDSVTISHIFMEWVLMLDYYGSPYDESEDRVLVEKMLKLLTDRGYVPYSLGGATLPTESWFQWPPDMMWARESVPFEAFGGQHWSN